MTGSVTALPLARLASNVTVEPAGSTTAATLFKSGIAPVWFSAVVGAQLAGSNQLPETPPTQVTAFKRVMLAVVLAPVATL